MYGREWVGGVGWWVGRSPHLMKLDFSTMAHFLDNPTKCRGSRLFNVRNKRVYYLVTFPLFVHHYLF